MKKKSRGVTIVEILTSIILVALLMTIFAAMASQYARVMLHQESRDRSLANTRMILHTVVSELKEAFRVYSPDTIGETKSEVTLWRFNPELPEAPLDTRGDITVRYFLDGKTLYRSATSSDGEITEYPVSNDVASFSVTREEAWLYKVRVSFEEPNRRYSLENKAHLRKAGASGAP